MNRRYVTKSELLALLELGKCIKETPAKYGYDATYIFPYDGGTFAYTFNVTDDGWQIYDWEHQIVRVVPVSRLFVDWVEVDK
jgi:hypothetical protein